LPKRLSLGRFVQILTGRGASADGESTDPKQLAREAAEHQAAAEAHLREVRDIAQRLKAQGLSFPGMDRMADFDQNDLDEVLKLQDAAARASELKRVSEAAERTLEAQRKEEAKVLEAAARYDDDLKKCQQRVDDFDRQTRSFSHLGLQALFDADPLTVRRKALAALKDPKDPRDRNQKIKALRDTLSGVEDICQLPDQAVEFEKLSAEASRLIYAKKEIVQELPRGASQRVAQQLLADYSDRFDALDKVPTLASVGTGSIGLQALLQDLASLDLSAPQTSEKRLKAMDSDLKALTATAAALPPSLAPAATKALADLQTRIDSAVVGRKPDGNAVEVPVGQSKVVMGGDELLRGLQGAMKAFKAAMADPNSPERKLLAMEGPDKVLDELVAMHTQLVAFGLPAPKLSPAEMVAIRRYTSQDYKVMNEQRLGLVQDPRAEFLNQTCEAALEKLPKYPKAAWPVFRLERAWDQSVVDTRYKRGNTFTAGVLWSTGARGSADVSGSDTRGPKFIHMIFGQSGGDIAALSTKPGEGSEDETGAKISKRRAEKRDVASGKGEVLFPSTARFKVTDRTDPPGGKALLQYDDNYTGVERIRTRLKEL
jgi:hypothetical protein